MRIENDVLAVLSSAKVDGSAVVLVGQLERKLYERANKVLEACGGKWSRKAKAHLFDGDAAERLDQVILTGEVEIPRDEFEFFPTPVAIVEQLLALAEVEPGMRVLEPSAGKGAIAYACARLGAAVNCIELNEANFAALAGDARLGHVSRADFLATEPSPEFDRVVMNPPFRRQADIVHVEHALGFLKPGGRLVSVMSAGVTFRSDRRASLFRSLVEERGGSIEDLPDGAFREAGTMVRTVVVTIDDQGAP